MENNEMYELKLNNYGDNNYIRINSLSIPIVGIVVDGQMRELVTNKLIVKSSVYQCPPFPGLNYFLEYRLDLETAVNHISKIRKLSREELKEYILKIEYIERKSIEAYEQYLSSIKLLDEIRGDALTLMREDKNGK